MRVRPESLLSQKAFHILSVGETMSVSEPVEIMLEDGSSVSVKRRLPKDLPIGYHDLRYQNGNVTRLVVSPKKCFLCRENRAWGWALQLYALRSKKSWGMGDFVDLREFAAWSRDRLKADFLLLNPVGAVNPTLPQEASPYYPSSRLYRNPLYLRIEEIAAAKRSKVSLEKLANTGRALNSGRLIDRDEVFRLKMSAFALLWKDFGDNSDFDNYVRREGELLERFAVFCALVEKFGQDQTKWPAQFRNPSSVQIKSFATKNSRVRFHQWLQWLLDRQFARAAEPLPIIQDLPVGFNPDGADAWVWQDLLAKDVCVGAPPDQFNTQGQNWGLRPFIPHKLRAANYEPFRQTIRAVLKYSKGLRIDHVMGLFRLFWIPKNSPAKDGVYVHYAVDKFLAILAIESQRARAVILGEDLGTVERAVRAKLRSRNILSYRVLWFQPGFAPTSNQNSLASVTTHDLPTVAGLWSGADLKAQTKLGLQPNEAATNALLKRMRRVLKLSSTTPSQEVILRVHQHLAKSKSRLITATLEDALTVEDRPNMPGTVEQWPNWRIGLPKTLESIQKDKAIADLAKSMLVPSMKRKGQLKSARSPHQVPSKG